MKFSKIEFNKKFDCIICLNADLPDKSVFECVSGIPIIAADGAALKLRNIGVESDYIIGDLDSLKNNLSEFDEKKIIRISDQETTDFEKVIEFVIKKNWKDILICGFHGGLLEHTLNNCSALLKYKNKLNFCLIDIDRYCLLVSNNIILEVELDELISLVPLPTVKITTQGLKWVLKEEILSLGVRDGIRNIAIEKIIKIEIHSGILFLFFNHRLPYCPQIL